MTNEATVSGDNGQNSAETGSSSATMSSHAPAQSPQQSTQSQEATPQQQIELADLSLDNGPSATDTLLAGMPPALPENANTTPIDTDQSVLTQSSEMLGRRLNLAGLVEDVESETQADMLDVELHMSKPELGALNVIQNDDVSVEYDKTLGMVFVSGAKEDVAEALQELYFIPEIASRVETFKITVVVHTETVSTENAVIVHFQQGSDNPTDYTRKSLKASTANENNETFAVLNEGGDKTTSEEDSIVASNTKNESAVEEVSNEMNNTKEDSTITEKEEDLSDDDEDDIIVGGNNNNTTSPPDDDTGGGSGGGLGGGGGLPSGENDAPDAMDDILPNLDEDTSLTFSADDLLANDSDINGDPIHIHAISAANGTIIDNGDGTYTYIPNANFNGEETISYTIRDSLGDTGSARATMTVNPINDAPIFTSTAVTSGKVNQAYSYDITAFDIDGDTLEITSQGALPAWLTLVDNGDGTASLTGTTSSAGDYDITLALYDGDEKANQSFTITIDPIGSGSGGDGDLLHGDGDSNDGLPGDGGLGGGGGLPGGDGSGGGLGGDGDISWG